MKLNLAIVTVFLLSSVTASAFSPIAGEAGSDLLAQFKCADQSTLGSQVNDNLTKLKTALGNVDTANQNCKGIVDALGKLPSIQALTAKLQNDASQTALKTAQAQLADYVADLATVSAMAPGDANLALYPSAATLQSQIAAEKATIEQDQVALGIDMQTNSKNNEIAGINQLNDFSDSLQKAITGSQTCLNAKPEVAASATTALMGIAGIFMSGPIGTEIGLGGALIQKIMGFIGGSKMGKINKTENIVQLEAGVSCVIKELSDQHCKIIREQNILKAIIGAQSCPSADLTPVTNSNLALNSTMDALQRLQALAPPPTMTADQADLFMNKFMNKGVGDTSTRMDDLNLIAKQLSDMTKAPGAGGLLLKNTNQKLVDLVTLAGKATNPSTATSDDEIKFETALSSAVGPNSTLNGSIQTLMANITESAAESVKAKTDAALNANKNDTNAAKTAFQLNLTLSQDIMKNALDSSNNNAQSALTTLQQTQLTSTGEIESFTKFASDQGYLDAIFGMLNGQGVSSGMKDNEAGNDTMNSLCMSLLGLNDLSTVSKYCADAAVGSGANKVKFSDYAGKQEPDRVCAMHDYDVKNKAATEALLKTTYRAPAAAPPPPAAPAPGQAGAPQGATGAPQPAAPAPGG